MLQTRFLRTIATLAVLVWAVAASAQFPDGETRYYTDDKGGCPMKVTFYYDKGDKCLKYCMPWQTQGILFKFFGMKDGLADYGQFKEMPHFGQYYKVYYTRERTYAYSNCESLLFNSDFSRITEKGGYGHVAQLHAISRQQYDRAYAAFRQRQSGGGGYNQAPGATSPAPRPGKPNARIVRVPCGTCHGSGRCIGCNGTGDMGDSYNLHDEKIVMRCSACSGSGRCLSCHGSGHTTTVVSN